MSATDIVNMRTSSWTSRRRGRRRGALAASDSRSPGFFEPKSPAVPQQIGPKEVGDAEEALFEGDEVVRVV